MSYMTHKTHVDQFLPISPTLFLQVFPSCTTLHPHWAPFHTLNMPHFFHLSTIAVVAPFSWIAFLLALHKSDSFSLFKTQLIHHLFRAAFLNYPSQSNSHPVTIAHFSAYFLHRTYNELKLSQLLIYLCNFCLFLPLACIPHKSREFLWLLTICPVLSTKPGTQQAFNSQGKISK